MTETDLRKTIKDKMWDLRLSTPQLARKLDLNQQTVYNYLAGRTQMNEDNLVRLLKVLGI